MRVMLVTWSDHFFEKLSILNADLEYCAIVVDEVEPVKKILEKVGLPNDLLYPLYDLKECVNSFYYDYIICIENGIESDLTKYAKLYGVPENKLINLSDVYSEGNFLLEAYLRYWKEHVTEFEIFATGISYVEEALDITYFKRNLFNFAFASQDLYYDFRIAKHVISREGHSKLRYALIGLAPYSFHYDLSKSVSHFRMLKYFIAFNDLHNFFIPAEVYRKLFREEYLKNRLPTKAFGTGEIFKRKRPLIFMTPQLRLNSRKTIDAWSQKNYPETRAENVKILDDYLTLCEENNIRPIMFLPPVSEGYVKHFNIEKLDEFYYLIRLARQKHPSALFVDGWQLPGFTYEYFFDLEHLNPKGAAKFSTYLSNVIEGLERQGR